MYFAHILPSDDDLSKKALPLFKYALCPAYARTSLCLIHNRVRAFFCSAGLEYLYCMSQLGLAVNCALITQSAIHCVTSYVMLNDLRACWRLIILVSERSIFHKYLFCVPFSFSCRYWNEHIIDCFNVSKHFFYSSTCWINVMSGC